MKYYRAYMDRQELSAGAHERLLALEIPRRSSRRRWEGYAALAACAALVIGVGVRMLLPAAVPEPGRGPQSSSFDPQSGGVVNTPSEELPLPDITFRDRTGVPEAAPSRTLAPGSFPVDLTPETIRAIFRGPDSDPEAGQDFLQALGWDGYSLRGNVWYDGQGRFTELAIRGEKDRAGFTLELRQGGLPFSCAIELNREETASWVEGVAVTGWSRHFDQDGDGQTDYICGSEFITGEQVGVRFVSRNNGPAGDGMEGEGRFNARFVGQALTGGLHLEHLLIADNIPAWRETSFDSLEQARQEEAFAPYLPRQEPEGYRAYPGNKDFHSYLRYQEGLQNQLFVRWSRGYDDIEVCVYRDGYYPFTLADPANPAGYDVRLYEIPWADTVPEQYWETVNRPAFRAEEITPAIIEARGRKKDTGSMFFDFEVLHPDGTLVSYRCAGMTAQQVWALVEETLS